MEILTRTNCSVCKGTGSRKMFETVGTVSGHYIHVSCPYCHGEGRIKEWRPIMEVLAAAGALQTHSEKEEYDDG